jgi:hypothetical protein
VDFEIAFKSLKATLKIPYSLSWFKEKVLNDGKNSIFLLATDYG